MVWLLSWVDSVYMKVTYVFNKPMCENDELTSIGREVTQKNKEL